MLASKAMSLNKCINCLWIVRILMPKTFVYSSDLGNLNMFLTIILKTINTIYCKDTFWPQHHNILCTQFIQENLLSFVWILGVHRGWVHGHESSSKIYWWFTPRSIMWYVSIGLIILLVLGILLSLLWNIVTTPRPIAT